MKVSSKKADERLVFAVVMLALGVIDAQTAAAYAGLTDAEFMQACADPAVLHKAEAERLRLKLSGKSAELRSALALDSLTEQLAGRLEAGEELPVSTVVRAGEFLLRVSGLEQTRAAELKAATPESGFAFAILHDGDPVPEMPETGFRFIVHLGSKQQADDVTPIEAVQADNVAPLVVHLPAGEVQHD